MQTMTKASSLGRPKKKLAKYVRAVRNFETLQALGRTGRYTATAMLGLAVLGKNEKMLPRILASAVVQLLSAPAEIIGIRKKNWLILHCLGKPRVCKELLKSVKYPPTKRMIFVLGNGKYNLTEKEALIALLKGEATGTDKGYANKALEREIIRLNKEGKLDQFK